MKKWFGFLFIVICSCSPKDDASRIEGNWCTVRADGQYCEVYFSDKLYISRCIFDDLENPKWFELKSDSLLFYDFSEDVIGELVSTSSFQFLSNDSLVLQNATYTDTLVRLPFKTNMIEDLRKIDGLLQVELVIEFTERAKPFMQAQGLWVEDGGVIYVDSLDLE